MRTICFAPVPFIVAWLAAPSLALAQPSEADRAEARRQFQTGVQQFQQRAFGPALEAFETAYRIAPHPSVRKNMAFCLQELGREAEALEQFERYLEEAQNIPPAERRGIDQRIRALRARVSELTLSVTPLDAIGLVVTVDDRVVSLARPIRLSPGQHTVRASATGYVPLTRELTTLAGQSQSLSLTLEREPPPPPPPSTDTSGSAPTPPVTGSTEGPLAASTEDVAPPTSAPALAPEERRGLPPAVFYSVVGMTGAAAIVWGVCGAFALSLNRDYEETVTAVTSRSSSDPSVPALILRGQDQASSAQRFALFADVAMGVTLLGAVAGTVLFFKTDFGSHRVHMTALPTSQGSVLGIGGTF